MPLPLQLIDAHRFLCIVLKDKTKLKDENMYSAFQKMHTRMENILANVELDDHDKAGAGHWIERAQDLLLNCKIESSIRHEILPTLEKIAKVRAEIKVEDQNDWKELIENNDSFFVSRNESKIDFHQGQLDKNWLRRRNVDSYSADAAKKEQEAIQSDMVELSHSLKQATIQLNDSLKEDEKLIHDVDDAATRNINKMATQQTHLVSYLKKSISFTSIMMLFVVIFAMFICMYLTMKIFPKKGQ